MTFTQVILKQFMFAKYQILILNCMQIGLLINKLKYFHFGAGKFAYAGQQVYLGQHGVTLKYVSPIEIVIIGGAQCSISVPFPYIFHLFMTNSIYEFVGTKFAFMK